MEQLTFRIVKPDSSSPLSGLIKTVIHR